MSAAHQLGKSRLEWLKLPVIVSLAGFLTVSAHSADAAPPGRLAASILGDTASHGATPTGMRPGAAESRKPLARLIRNPDDSNGKPAYALADQSGTIQRYVEPVPGIDLEPYVGYAVMVKHDTGRTLLASQLELPNPNGDPPAEQHAGSGGVDALFQDILETPGAPSGVQPAQYVPQSMAPVVIQDGAPPMMGPQDSMPYDPSAPNMGGVPWNTYQPGGAPVYLDGPPPCGAPGCTTCPTPVPCAPQPMQMVPVVPVQPQLMWSLWGDALWLHPTGADMAHAQQQNGIGGAGTVPFGQIGVVDPDFDLGFRVGGEGRLSPKESVFVQYAWFQSNSASSLDAPNIPGGGGAVGSLVHHPGAALTASAGPVTATYDIDFQLGDVACRYLVACTRTSEVSVFLGGRWGRLEQRFDQQGIFGGGQGGAIDTGTNIDFDGGGPMVGVTGERLIGCTRFSVYGRSLIAAISGEFRAHYLEFNDTTDSTLAEVFWNDDRIVPMLDYELGIAWTGPNNHLRFAVGYMASIWYNAVTTPVFVDAVQADNYVDVADTLAFDGAVGRAEIRW